jgi:hypothetical protein
MEKFHKRTAVSPDLNEREVWMMKKNGETRIQVCETKFMRCTERLE